MICCFFSSFKTFAMSREATDPPAAVNVLDVSSESMAAFQVFLYGRFWVFTEELTKQHGLRSKCKSRKNDTQPISGHLSSYEVFGRNGVRGFIGFLWMQSL